MTSRERAYNRKLKELISKVGKLEDREVKKVMEILEASRKEVAAAVVSTEWQAHHITQLKEAIELAIEGFKQQYTAGHNEALSNMWNAGIDTIDSPLQYAGINLMAPEIPRVALEILQGYSTDLISGLSGDTLKKISNEITLGIIGQKSPYEVMKTIGRSLDEKGIYKSTFHRAEAITRTEMARIHSSAKEARIQSLTEGRTDPSIHMMKKWLSSGKAHPRENHLIDGELAEIDDNFSNGILYPHAPGLPAKEVVNCG